MNLNDCSQSVEAGGDAAQDTQTLLDGAEETLNEFLALFARFRSGKHPFLEPYMRLLSEVDFPD